MCSHSECFAQTSASCSSGSKAHEVVVPLVPMTATGIKPAAICAAGWDMGGHILLATPHLFG